jgi:hypothetical protein
MAGNHEPVTPLFDKPGSVNDSPLHIAGIGVNVGVTSAATVKVYVAVAGTHGEPAGLFVVKVNTTVLPASDADGVYVILNGVVLKLLALSNPLPFDVTFTSVALPPKILPLNVMGVLLHVDPDAALNVSTVAVVHPQLNVAGDEATDIQPVLISRATTV